MSDLSRRKFIKDSLLTIATAITSTTCFSGAFNGSPALVHECKIVYSAWKQTESLEPSEYLRKKQNFTSDNPLSIKKETEIDFVNQDFIYINGLRLGKTEAALLACIGSNCI